jgi:hypothetical protein
MTLAEHKELIQFLREQGTSHYKSGDFEVSFRETPPAASLRAEADKLGNIPHHITEMASLLKLSDKELVDQLFPEPKNEDDAHPERDADIPEGAA